MDTSSLTREDADATRRAMEYWIGKWDWECPTLFGVELEELKSVVALWPEVGAGAEEAAALCALGAWREILYGASAAMPDKVHVVTGVTSEHAEEICARIQTLARRL